MSWYLALLGLRWAPALRFDPMAILAAMAPRFALAAA